MVYLQQNLLRYFFERREVGQDLSMEDYRRLRVPKGMLHPRPEVGQGNLFGLQPSVLCKVAALEECFVHTQLKGMIQGQVVGVDDIGRYVEGNSVSKGVAEILKVRKPRITPNEIGLHLADLFDMQDEIVARLAGDALNAQLIAAEARRAEKAPSPDSMDLYFQGMAWLNKGLTPDSLVRARSFFIARSSPILTTSTR